MSFDGHVARYRFTQEWGSANMFSRSAMLLAKMKTAATMRVELNWYSSGRVIFPFDLTGAKAVIDDLSSRCRP